MFSHHISDVPSGNDTYVITHMFAAQVKRSEESLGDFSGVAPAPHQSHVQHLPHHPRPAQIRAEPLGWSAVKITVLAGGVGGAKFLVGVREAFGANGSESPHSLRAVVNIGDDAWMHGVRICPDLDSCMYTLGGGVDPERGWGHRNETWHCQEELAAYGIQPDWFRLGDRDLATHLVRTQLLNAGYTLSDITTALSQRWQPGFELLPASDDRCETHVVITNPDTGDKQAVHFQQWWVQYRAQVETHSFAHVGAEDAQPSPAAAAAIAEADVIVIAPSNPVVSIGAILAIPGIRGALRSASAPIVGVSPIIGGKVLRGMADRCLSVIGVDATAAGVAGHYGARSAGGILDAWLVAEEDLAATRATAPAGLTVAGAPLLMDDAAATAAMVRAALAAVGVDAP